MHLLYLCMVWTRDELLKVGKAFGFCIGIHQLRFYERFSSLFACHLQISHQVFPVFCEINENFILFIEDQHDATIKKQQKNLTQHAGKYQLHLTQF